MKKIVSSLLAGVLLLTLSSTSMAQEVESKKESVEEFERVEIISGEEVNVSGQIISIPEESIGLFGAGERRASIENYKPLFSNWYTVATSSADYTQDEITARARLYNKSGTLWGSDSQSLTDARSVTATAKSGINDINFNGAYSLGDHTYKRSGYIDTSLETRKDW
ncbi:hypothetical protein P4H39_19840 [Paenibacillus lautus]|uniref:hypothetical protein n=1 Tax=Paenibacillus lautus TaxID=1401 RepID=UPI002DBB3402|nr:hypothetical protein [Paenibacillus lautus]MEC0204862.1 hypothetical protein [Paenibacillus lautus]